MSVDDFVVIAFIALVAGSAFAGSFVGTIVNRVRGRHRRD